MAAGRTAVVARSMVLLGIVLATVARADHDTDCTAAGGSNGPAQLDCTLPDFLASVGSTTVLTSSFIYTPSVENNPPTCAVGTLTVDPPGQWLSIDSNVLDASGAGNADEVVVSVDPTGLPEGVYEGVVRIMLTVGAAAPQCPSQGDVSGEVSVRLRVTNTATAPMLSPLAAAFVVGLLGAAGYATLRRRRLDHGARPY